METTKQRGATKAQLVYRARMLATPQGAKAQTSAEIALANIARNRTEGR